MNTDSDNTELEKYLRGDSELSGLYEKSKDLVTPQHLNTNIEFLAREELKNNKDSDARGSAGIMKWPLAMAASIAIALLIAVFYRTAIHPDASQQLASRENTSISGSDTAIPIANGNETYAPAEIHRPAVPVPEQSSPDEQKASHTDMKVLASRENTSKSGSETATPVAAGNNTYPAAVHQNPDSHIKPQQSHRVRQKTSHAHIEKLASQDNTVVSVVKNNPVVTDSSGHSSTEQHKQATSDIPLLLPDNSQISSRETDIQKTQELTQDDLHGLLAQGGAGENTASTPQPDDILETLSKNQWQEENGVHKSVQPEQLASQSIENYAQQQKNVHSELQEFIRQTNTEKAAMTRLLPDNILKTWTLRQWQKHVARLEASNRSQLAQQYIKAFSRLFPGETLHVENLPQ